MMSEDKILSVKLPRFRGQHEKWHEWRADFVAVLGGYDLLAAINNPRPADIPPAAPAPVVGVGAEGVAGEGGEGAVPDGGGAGIGVAPAVVPPAAVAAPAGPPGGRTPGEVWDLKNARVYMYLLMYTEGDARATVSQFSVTRSGVEAWNALLEKYDPQGQLGSTILSSQLTNLRYKPGTDPDQLFLEAERLNGQMRALGQAYPDQALSGMLLTKLPRDVYGPLITYMDTQASLTYAEFKTLVRTCWRRHLADKEFSKLMTGVENSTRGTSGWFVREGGLENQD